jgi:hypothetical protein
MFASGTAAYAVSFTAADTGTLRTIYTKFHSSATGKFIVGLYSNVGDAPSTLLGSGYEQTVSTGWNTSVMIPVNITAGTNYWLVISRESTTDIRATNNSTVAALYKVITYTGTLPSSVSGGWSVTSRVKMYAEGCH